MAINLVRRYTAVRGATLIIAASNSLDRSRADYYCDGVADEVEINQAIANLPAGGGKILLLEGTFNISSGASPINLNKNNVTLEGQGRGSILRLINNGGPGVIIQINNTGDVVNNLFVDINSGNQGAAICNGIDVSGTESRIEGIWITYPNNGHCIELSGDKNLVCNCIIDLIGAAVLAEGVRISGNENIIADNYFEGWTSVYLTGASSDNIIMGNNIRDALVYGIYSYDDVDTPSRNIIINNVIYNNIAASRGIYLRKGDNCVIEGNDIFRGTTAGIELLEADNNIINNNRVIQAVTGIRISHVNCDNNLVSGNITYSSGIIVDLGTNTQIFDNIET